MRKRLHDKKAGLAILSALIILSLLDVILRGTIFRDVIVTTPNLGEPLATVLFSIVIIVFSLTGKDRVCYLLYAGWLGYFVMKQLFDLPGMIVTYVSLQTSGTASFSAVTCTFIHVLSMICIVAIGGLLVEYMNDGSIYNRAFNMLCTATILMLNLHVLIIVCDLILGAPAHVVLAIINCLTRVTMVYMLSFFAFDSAKLQLSKTKL